MKKKIYMKNLIQPDQNLQYINEFDYNIGDLVLR